MKFEECKLGDTVYAAKVMPGGVMPGHRGTIIGLYACGDIQNVTVRFVNKSVDNVRIVSMPLCTSAAKMKIPIS